jgi:predicted dehydrogenase
LTLAETRILPYLDGQGDLASPFRQDDRRPGDGHQFGRSTVGVILVGLGPHARRIYVHQLKLLGVHIDAVVELASMRDTVAEWCANSLLIEVPVTDRDLETVSASTEASLDEILSRRDRTQWRAIISTEPKAHLAYLRYFASRRVIVLVDKPITAPTDVINSLDKVERIRTDYEELVDLTTDSPGLIKVQCQRRHHPGYRYIRSLLAGVVADYGVPVTTLEIYHGDGMWNMPGEFLQRENHPYKYGYGKLFHSGYHFVDLAAWLLDVNAVLPVSQRADSVRIQASCVTPNDLRAVLPDDRMARFFGAQAPQWGSPEAYEQMGELDVFATAQFRHGEQTLTTLSLALTQTGFSRRAWPLLPVDTYKSNGRVRHERLSAHVGPLLNV